MAYAGTPSSFRITCSHEVHKVMVCCESSGVGHVVFHAGCIDMCYRSGAFPGSTDSGLEDLIAGNLLAVQLSHEQAPQQQLRQQCSRQQRPDDKLHLLCPTNCQAKAPSWVPRSASAPNLSQQHPIPSTLANLSPKF